MAYTDINSEDRLVQKTFAEHLQTMLGWESIYAWNDETFFRSVRLGSHGAIEWGSEIDLCPDAMYMRLTGKSPEELFPALRSVHADA